MQADYHLNLTFPHPTSPKAANKVASRELPFSLMKLPHLITFPFSYKTVEKWATVLSPWHVRGRCKGCQASTTHPQEAHPSISKRRLLVHVGAMLGKMPQPQPTPVFYLCSTCVPGAVRCQLQEQQGKNYFCFVHNCAPS